jgi:hypothetical protein
VLVALVLPAALAERSVPEALAERAVALLWVAPAALAAPRRRPEPQAVSAARATPAVLVAPELSADQAVGGIRAEPGVAVARGQSRGQSRGLSPTLSPGLAPDSRQGLRCRHRTHAATAAA